MTGIRKRDVDDWHLSNEILDETMVDILKQVKVSRDYDVPYLAGYSVDGKTIYIDRNIPITFTTKSKKKVETKKYLVLHEAIEKALIDKLGLHYQFAHQIALRTELAAIMADSISWQEYNDFMEKLIKEVGDEQITSLPPDLDITPYKDEKDFKLLKRMSKSLSEEFYVPLLQELDACEKNKNKL